MDSTLLIGNNIQYAAQCLQDGNLIGIPTETVYGLAANALKAEAAVRIFTVKNRPTFDPLIVHIADIAQMTELATSVPQWASDLMRIFAPGPLTVLIPKKSIVPDIITSGLSRVAVRIPNHPLTLELLRTVQLPLAAPSANPFGYISPTTAQHVAEQLGEKVSYILDGGACSVGVESTIIGEESGKLVVYRLGGLPIETLQSLVGKIEIRPSTSSPAAPGMLHSHYAPRKPFYVGNISQLLLSYTKDNMPIGVLSFEKSYSSTAYNLVLSPQADISEAAQNLFAYMRQLDQSPVEAILAEWLPNEGLGAAINDRLRRAASPALHHQR